MSKTPSIMEVFFGPTNRVVTLKLIRYSLMMFLIPLLTFYITWIVIYKKDKDMLGWSGLVAVLSANVVIASYVIMAWNEDRDKVTGKNKIIHPGFEKKKDRVD
jgi:hypothetical protein